MINSSTNTKLWEQREMNHEFCWEPRNKFTGNIEPVPTGGGGLSWAWGNSKLVCAQHAVPQRPTGRWRQQSPGQTTENTPRGPRWEVRASPGRWRGATVSSWERHAQIRRLGRIPSAGNLEKRVGDSRDWWQEGQWEGICRHQDEGRGEPNEEGKGRWVQTPEKGGPAGPGDGLDVSSEESGRRFSRVCTCDQEGDGAHAAGEAWRLQPEVRTGLKMMKLKCRRAHPTLPVPLSSLCSRGL